MQVTPYRPNTAHNPLGHRQSLSYKLFVCIAREQNEEQPCEFTRWLDSEWRWDVGDKWRMRWDVSVLSGAGRRSPSGGQPCGGWWWSRGRPGDAGRWAEVKGAVARCVRSGRVGSLVLGHAGTGRCTSRWLSAKPGVPCVAACITSMRNRVTHARQTRMPFGVVATCPD